MRRAGVDAEPARVARMHGHLQPRRELQQALHAAREGSAVPVVEQPPGVQHEADTRDRAARPPRPSAAAGTKRALPSGKRLAVEKARPGMVRRGARPLEAALAVEARVRHAGQERASAAPSRRRSRRRPCSRTGRARRGRARAATRLASSARDPPVRPRLARRLDGLAHALHAALGVGERALLLGEGGRGQEDVSALGRLVQEEILDDQETRAGRMAFSAWWRSGSESSGFSPTTYIARTSPVRHPSTISVTTRPGSAGGRIAPPRLEARERLRRRSCW